MKNPWIEVVEDIDESNYILKQENEIIEKFNNRTDDRYKIHTKIMPAPFMGNVLESPIVLLTLNPGYDEKEADKEYYDRFKSYWKNEIQHIPSIPELPLFCLNDEYIKYSDYWMNKLKPLITVTSKKKVAENISVIQYFPYHSKKYKNIPKRILDGYLNSQEYNFHLVRKAIDRKALIIVLRSKRLWFEAVPQLNNKRTRFTRSYQNPILSKNNLLETFEDVVTILNGLE